MSERKKSKRKKKALRTGSLPIRTNNRTLGFTCSFSFEDLPSWAMGTKS